MKALSILKYCNEFDLAEITQYLSGFGERYVSRFFPKEICTHIKLSRLISEESPVKLVIGRDENESIDVTVIALDFPSLFSLITGVLSSLGMNIVEGEIFTQRDGTPRRIIVDRFKGILERPVSFIEWKNTLEREIKIVFDKLSMKGGGVEAKRYVNEMVATALSRYHYERRDVLYPIEIEFSNSEKFTEMSVKTEDTPFFLYAMSSALSLQGISIENVSIKTFSGRIEDEFQFVDLKGRRIENPEKLDRIKFSVLLTKQFTYFLPISPDPYSALLRFEELLNKVFSLPEREAVLKTISDTDVLGYLARLLGISDFLWEDFIRLQYETLIPMLKPVIKGESFADSPERVCENLKRIVETAKECDEKEKLLNEYKDRQIFLLDLNHILIPSWDIKKLSRGLTKLAECVITVSFQIAYEELARRYGVPRTIAGLDAKYALFGLGKLGGEALGYASDIEILFVYSDQGATDGDERIKNYEFFERLVRKATSLIHAKSEGIFHIDLRLRPYGNAGPLACSLERFCSYYGRNGEAHSYEKLALVRLRFIGGDNELGVQIEKIRDDLIYTEGNISIGDLRKLREKQYREKCRGKLQNVKYCPGALVDIEYAVQILQVMYGGKFESLRTPKIHEALESLVSVSILEEEEARLLIDAYYFLRRLINALRMLRGSAKDLFLPEINSIEFEHLARRMGYRVKNGIFPSQELQMDFEAKTAMVRSFLKKYFGKDSVPGSGYGSVADIVLSDTPEEGAKEKILRELGFSDYKRAYLNLKRLAGDGGRRKTFSRLIVLASNILKRQPSPDAALNNWERFERVIEFPEEHFVSLMSQPKRLEIMLDIFGSSEYLANTLIGNPDFFDWVTMPETINRVRKSEAILYDLKRYVSSSLSLNEWLDSLRLFKRREILRIGTRDICMKKPIEEIMLELSELADTIIGVAMEKALIKVGLERRGGFCILTFGKLGGKELNYSSDVDLLALYDDDEWRDEAEVERLFDVMKVVREILSQHTDRGYLYRVDFRLRPYGNSGELVQSVSSIVNYYKKFAREWEVQALLKLRPVSGDVKLGGNVADVLRSISFNRFSKREIEESILSMRNASERKLVTQRLGGVNVKDGPGGIRDIEFLIQGLQLIYWRDKPEIIDGNTLSAIEKLESAGIIENEIARELRNYYLFLRRVEHFLQIYGDRQKHSFTESDALILGRSMLEEIELKDYSSLNEEFVIRRFYERVNKYMERVRKIYLTLLSRE